MNTTQLMLTLVIALRVKKSSKDLQKNPCCLGAFASCNSNRHLLGFTNLIIIENCPGAYAHNNNLEHKQKPPAKNLTLQTKLFDRLNKTSPSQTP